MFSFDITFKTSDTAVSKSGKNRISLQRHGFNPSAVSMWFVIQAFP